MSVLDSVADGAEQIQPLTGGQTLLVREIGDGHALDQLHHEVGAPRLSSSRTENPGNVRVVHPGQRLLLDLESGDHIPTVHSRFDDLQGDFSADPLSPEDVAVIFSTTLGDLLRAKGYQGAKGRQIPKRYMVWNDPLKTPMPAGYSTSQKWADSLAKFDCVVLLRDHPDYDIDFIKKHAKNVVDARNHAFDPERDLSAKEKNLPIQITYTGVVPIVYKAQATLLSSLIDSIGWAFVMIAAVMMVLLRTKKTQILNVRGGLVSMLPNVFPVILIFGAMGHWGLTVDIGTMMTASVAMGVAVDDTIHFLTWFRDGIRQGLDRKTAIKEAYGRVALAMTQTTLIGGLGLSVLRSARLPRLSDSAR